MYFLQVKLKQLLKSYRRLSEHLHSNMSYWRSGDHISSFPGSCAGEEERELGTHCSHMCYVPMVTCILLGRMSMLFSPLTPRDWE